MEPRGLPLVALGVFTGKPLCELIEAAYVPDRHLHKEVECVYVMRGQLTVRVDEHVFYLSEGELLLIPGNVMHEVQRKMLEDQVVKLKFMQEWMMPDFFSLDEKQAYQRLFNYTFRTQPNPVVKRIVHKIFEHRQRDAYAEYFIFAGMVELIALLLSAPEIIVEKSKANLEHPRYLEAMLDFIHANSHTNLTLPLLARHIGITESYCSKYIKRHTGLSFVQYLNAVRVNNAQRLLIYSDMSVGEVMENTGFFSIQTFNRVFKQQTGRSPLEYRRQKRMAEQRMHMAYMENTVQGG